MKETPRRISTWTWMSSASEYRSLWLLSSLRNLFLTFTLKVINYKSVNVSNASGDERLRKSLFTNYNTYNE